MSTSVNVLENPSTKATGKTDNSHAKACRRYLVASAGCALFAFIYAQFSHDVYSPFMTFMFAIPLIAGALPAFICHATKEKPLPRLTRQAWALAIASLTVASCLRGIFEIAGTSSPLLWAYPIAVLAFVVLAAIPLLRRTQQKQG